MTGSDAASARIDTSRPHPARVYDWWLGGKDNYPVVAMHMGTRQCVTRHGCAFREKGQAQAENINDDRKAKAQR
ncbi:SAM-dependent methyltransferase [Streptomyces sp. NBC_01352]|uniref:SAM-dependent methyltransferase n=1 Tax=Streptomyces sp. NBC_01352 TaxID=2903834 RepID=UPI003FCE8133